MEEDRQASGLPAAGLHRRSRPPQAAGKPADDQGPAERTRRQIDPLTRGGSDVISHAMNKNAQLYAFYFFYFATPVTGRGDRRMRF